jgi:hypothetical protein
MTSFQTPRTMSNGPIRMAASRLLSHGIGMGVRACLIARNTSTKLARRRCPQSLTTGSNWLRPAVFCATLLRCDWRPIENKIRFDLLSCTVLIYCFFLFRSSYSVFSMLVFFFLPSYIIIICLCLGIFDAAGLGCNCSTKESLGARETHILEVTFFIAFCFFLSSPC